MRRVLTVWGAALATWGICWASPALADMVQVAVAANFTAPMQRIAAAFERDTGHKAVLAFGSTGKFYAQIQHGAPFAVLLAADDETPARLMREGLGVTGSAFTYATGQLVLWSPKAEAIEATQGDAVPRVLQRPLTGKLALADPKLAPYGAAAVQALQRLGLAQRLAPQLVQGESIAQAFQFVKSGNAALGLVALSQVMVDGRITSGSAWVVPGAWHDPIRQDALLLKAGETQPAARALLQYLRGDVARHIIRAHGYLL